MPSEDLFAAEEGVISAAEELIANGSFADREDRQRFAELLKNYQKLFRTTRRLMRLSDRNEQQLNAMGQEQRRANEITAQKKQGARSAFQEAVEISFTANLPFDLHWCPECRDRLEPQETHHFLLRCGQFHRDHRQARIGGSHQPAEPIFDRNVEHRARARRDHRQIYR
jgi:hypothetical protein